MFDCTTPNYETLYARWLTKPGALLDWAEYDPTRQDLLDLCGGTGAISKEAVRRGAKDVWLLDLRPRANDPRIHPLWGRAEDLFYEEKFNPLSYNYDDILSAPRRPHRYQWDLIVCRQALGYLRLGALSRALARVLKPGGRFVFNTFVRPKFAAKIYRHDGRIYFEASGFLGRTVVHLQAAGGDFDITKFHWWTEDDVRDAFVRSGLFSVRRFKNTDTTFWFDLERVRPLVESREPV